MNDPRVASVHWENEDDAATATAPSATAQTPDTSKIAPIAVPLIVGALLVLIVGSLIVVGRSTTRDLAEPATDANPPQSTTVPPASSSTTTTLPSAPGTRAISQFDGQVLGVNLGASVVSTDFDGRMFALDLDTGILTRSLFRTGYFVTLAGQLVVQTGCGGWQILEVPSFVLGDELIDCSTSYRPIDRLGGEASVFVETGSEPTEGVLVDDGEGGLIEVQLGDDVRSSIVTTSGGRVLVDRDGVELVWVDPATNTTESYATGRLLAGGPNGILWFKSCESDGACLVWFGTPDNPQIHAFRVDPFDLDQPARINPQGSRAVFFKSDGVLRIVSTETGHAREVENPGITASLATWSPDGLWLLETSGVNIVALNTLNGRVTEFEGIPGDFSPGWIALPVTG